MLAETKCADYISEEYHKHKKKGWDGSKKANKHTF